MATSIAKTSVAVGMDASAFKTGAESLKGYFKDIGATAGKLIGVLGLASLSFSGIKAGIEGSLGKVIAFEKTQAILEAIGKTAGDSKESVAGLVSTLSTITGRNDEAGKALGDMARKMMSIGFSAAETEKMVNSFYNAAKASPAEIGETYSTLQNMALNLDEFGFVSLKQYKAVAQLGIPIMEIMAAKISEMRGVTVTAEEVAAQLKLAQATGGATGITTQEQLQVLAGLGDSELVKAQIEAIGNTFAGAMGKAKGEISLMFFEIGKAINAFFGGTKTYVSIFKMITAGVKAAREQIELLGDVFSNNRQWIEDFKHGIDILVVAFFRGFEVMGEQLVESKNIISEWFNIFVSNIPAIENSIGEFFTATKDATIKFFSAIGTGVLDAISGIKNALVGIVSGGFGLIKSLFSLVGTVFISIGSGFKSLLSILTFGLSDFIGKSIASVVKFSGWLVSKFFEAYYNIFKGLALMVFNGFAYVAMNFKSILSKITFGLSDLLGSASLAVIKFAGWIAARFFEAYYNIFKGLLNFITFGFSNKVIDSVSAITAAIYGFFTAAKAPAQETNLAIKGITTETGAATAKVNYLQEIFKGFGEYMTDFSNNFQAIFKVFEVITDSFGNDVYRVTNIWEGMYEVIQTIKTAAQVGFLAIAEIGVNSINGILKVFEDLASFTQKWIDKFSYGLGRIGEAMGLLAKGTADMMVSDDLRRGDPKFNFGRLNGSNMAEARANIQAQAEEERRARLQLYNERKKAADQAKAGMENPDFARNKGAGAQLAAPTLLSAGGAEEYKLIVERNNAKLMDGTKKTNELLEQANDHLEQIAQNKPIAPGVTVVPLIARG